MLNESTLTDRFRAFDSPKFCYKVDEKGPLTKRYPFLEKEAAVLLLLRRNAVTHEWELFLNLRSHNVGSHKGEVAFPGGKRDPGDLSPAHTALRESYEEVGLPFTHVKLLGTLFPMVTRYNYLLYPVVGILKDLDFTPRCNNEVDFTFWLPLERFLSTDRHARRTVSVRGKELSTNVFVDAAEGHPDELITFGITSFICILAAMIAFQRKPAFRFPNLSEAEVLRQRELSPVQLVNLVQVDFLGPSGVLERILKKHVLRAKL